MPTRKALISVVLLGWLAAACAQQTQIPGTSTPQAATGATAIPAQQPSPVPTSAPTMQPSQTPSGIWITLTPDRGKPGDTIQIQGYLPGGPTQQSAQNDQSMNQVTVCWQGCLTGLTEEGQPVEWSGSEPGHFSTQFRVPDQPWLGNKGPEALQPGDYTVGVQCLAGQAGCALERAQASAMFHMEGPTPKTCQSGQPCAKLTFTPDQGPPGTEVQVQGWAPLVAIIGNEEALGYNLVLVPTSAAEAPVNLGQIQQAMDGTITGSFVVPQQEPSLGTLAPGSYQLALSAIRPQASPNNRPPLVGETSFEITAALTWSQLELGQPVRIEPSANLVEKSLTVEPSKAGVLAYCGQGEIQVTQDGGRTWSKFSTSAVATVAEAAGYPLMAQNTAGQPACDSVILDPAHPDSYFAIFQAANKQYGAPPVFFMGYVSTDGGQTWKMVPAPQGSTQEMFGGFWSNGSGIVQALFSGQSGNPGATESIVIEQTSDGGATWSASNLTCPSSGGCLRWGPAPGSIPGMGSPLPQYILASTDGGKTWIQGPSAELRTVDPKEVVSFSDLEALLIDGSADFPVQLTEDGGKTWQVVGVTAMPGASGSAQQFSGLQILPDGALVALSPDGSSWMRLDPRSDQWCAVSGTNVPKYATLLQVSGEQLWWLPANAQAPEHAAISNMNCGG
jgi:photosystem II stability/assembly factor-like uncharacterized protein